MLYPEILIRKTFHNMNDHSLYLSDITHLSPCDKIVHQNIIYVIVVDEHSQSIHYLVWGVAQGMS